jgi:hypothetical protein
MLANIRRFAEGCQRGGGAPPLVPDAQIGPWKFSASGIQSGCLLAGCLASVAGFPPQAGSKDLTGGRCVGPLGSDVAFHTGLIQEVFMFDSLADRIRHDEREQTNGRERAIRWMVISVLSVLLFLGLYAAVRSGG